MGIKSVGHGEFSANAATITTVTCNSSTTTLVAAAVNKRLGLLISNPGVKIAWCRLNNTGNDKTGIIIPSGGAEFISSAYTGTINIIIDSGPDVEISVVELV